jgi:hypothetical protein
MKSKTSYILITMLILSIWQFKSYAQTSAPKGKAQLTEFTNATAKFTVPEGKTWYIYNIFFDTKSDDGKAALITLKSINDVNFEEGSYLFSSNQMFVMRFPLVFPEKTTFELTIQPTKYKAIMTYIETDN